MKTKLLFTIASALLGFSAYSQCHYIPATSIATDTLSYTLVGGAFQSYGCAPIDPTYWISGNGKSVTVTFVNPQNNPSFRVWGMNDDDTAIVSVNTVSYPLNAVSASYNPKVVCGLSPGPNGVLFANGKLVGANSNSQGNFSYQDIQLNASNVTSFKVTGTNGAGWGFAGVLVNCPLPTGITNTNANNRQASLFPNPLISSTTLQFSAPLINAELNFFDLYGQKIKTIKNISGDQVIIERADLPSGIYFIRVMQDDVIISTNKIIVAE